MAGIPLVIWERHKKIFLDRAISPEFALLDGYRSLTHDDACKAGFGAGLGSLNGKSLDGIGIYFDPDDIWTETPTKPFRLRPDAPLRFPDGRPAKYLQRKNEANRLFEPHTNEPSDKTDPTVPLIITESELKATAIAENVLPLLSERPAILGLTGVNCGWARPKKIVEKPDGSREKEKYGPPVLIPDFESWNLEGRKIYLCNDSDVASVSNAEEFQRSKRSGAWGAEFTQAQLLRQQKSIVLIMELPAEPDGSKNGADDYLVRYGPQRFIDLMKKAVVARDVEAAIDSRLVWSAQRALEPQPPMIWTLEGIYRPGTIVFDVGDGGSFKTWALLDRAVCMAMGKPWLGRETIQTPVLIIDQESDTLYLRRRLGWVLRGHGVDAKNIRDVPIYCTTELYLNLASPKDRDRLRSLIERFSAGLVVMDSWAALTSGCDENKTSEVAAVLMGMKFISRSLPSCLSTIHHTNKQGGFRGNVGLKDHSDVMLMCQRQPDDIISYSTEFPGKSRASRIDPFSAKANFNDDRELFFLSPTDGGASVRLTEAEIEVLEILTSSGPLPIAEIASKTFAQRTPKSVADTLSKLRKKGKVARIDLGGRGTAAIYQAI